MSVGKLQRKSLPFSNVVATGVATAPITPGRTIENICLKLGGTTFTKAMIDLIKIKANGKVILEGSGNQFNKLNAYKGEATDAAFLPLSFLERAGDTDLDREIGSFDTSLGIANITAEVSIAGATAPTLEAILTESAVQRVQGQNGQQVADWAPLMAKVLRYPFSQAVGGTLPVTLPFGRQNGAIIKRIHVEHTGNMTGAVVKQDGVVIHESLKAENEFEQKRWGRVPQTNMYTIDFIADGKVRDALDTRDARSLEYLLTFSAADNGFILVEYLDTLGNL